MRILQNGASELGVELDERQLVLFDLYQRELLLWNKKTNLISEKTASEIVTRHFLDSLVAVRYIASSDARMVDIGCGAGFPGLPVKIAIPSIQLCLLETNRKKISFLKHILRVLNISNALTLQNRTEHVVQAGQWREKFDIVISRAAMKLHELMSLGDFFLPPGGLLITLKGAAVEDELKKALSQKDNSKIYQIKQYDIIYPFLGPPRKIIIAQKIK